jgi:hypothetical protein
LECPGVCGVLGWWCGREHRREQKKWGRDRNGASAKGEGEEEWWPESLPCPPQRRLCYFMHTNALAVALPLALLSSVEMCPCLGRVDGHGVGRLVALQGGPCFVHSPPSIASPLLGFVGLLRGPSGHSKDNWMRLWLMPWVESRKSTRLSCLPAPSLVDGGGVAWMALEEAIPPTRRRRNACTQATFCSLPQALTAPHTHITQAQPFSSHVW